MASYSLEPWSSYALNEQDPYWVLQELPRKEARKQFERTMAMKSERIAELHRLLEGFGITLDRSDRAIQSMNDWFVGVVNPLPDRNVPDGVSLSVCEDVALYLGEIMISRHSDLRWDFFTWGKSNGSYQCHVIMGFPFDNPVLHTNLDLAGIVHGYGVSVLRNRTGAPEALQLPAGHPLSGVQLDPVPLQARKFVDLLEKVDRRFVPDGSKSNQT
ncbi:hypothetical protein [Microbacterium sp. PMB16]|uniref:hypothetical protein n=1 Tax=Microbacterium sp. PMB16 TaxID=3120157 RepID=UPI003F4C7742